MDIGEFMSALLLAEFKEQRRNIFSCQVTTRRPRLRYVRPKQSCSLGLRF